jgi:phosphonate transport system substrate-binding protein
MKLITCLTLAALLAWGSSAQAREVCEDPRPLRVAFIPKSSLDAQRLHRPLLQALERALGRPVQVLPMASNAAIMEGVLSDAVDLADLGPASYTMVMERKAVVTAFATVARRNPAGALEPMSYRSVLITRRDSRLGSLADLRGKTLGLTDPASTSGALVPRQAVLQLTGRTLDAHFDSVVYAGSHDLAIQAVQRRLVDAAFVSSTRLEEALRQGRVQAQELTEVWRSAELPLDPYVHRSRLCRPLVEKIREVFFSAAPDFEPMFRAMGVAGFVPVGDAEYQAVRELFSSSGAGKK